jgi:hydroxypyruvate isomerase
MHTYELRNERIMSEREQQPPLDIEVLRWDAESFTVEGINLELENLRGQRIPRLILRHNGKIIDNLIRVVITRVYKHQDYRHRHEETEFRYIKDVMHDTE